MAVTVLMPKIGITVESCLIGAWNKHVGDKVAVGDILFGYETDKAAFECESTADGTLLEIFYNDGDEAPVLAPVCIIGAAGESVEAGAIDMVRAVDAAGTVDAAGAIDAAGAASEAGDIDAAGAAGKAGAKTDSTISDTIKISPRARNLAKRLGIDYNAAIPSGPHGRVIERDIESLAHMRAIGATPAPRSLEQAGRASAPADIPGRQTQIDTKASATGAANGNSEATAFTEEKLPHIRRVIAKTMQKSLAETAQLTHHHSFDATKILALRTQFKQEGKPYGLDGVTIGDIIIYVVSRVLCDFPDFNAHLINGDLLRRFYDAHLGVAIDTERGLLVPTLFNANKKTLRQLSEEIKELAKSARAGTINPDLLSGASFTISNLGATGIEMFTPIINPPQVAILGICGITTRVREAPGGGLEAFPSMGISLTYDHRAVDGAPAAVFAQKICGAMQNADLLLISDI